MKFFLCLALFVAAASAGAIYSSPVVAPLAYNSIHSYGHGGIAPLTTYGHRVAPVVNPLAYRSPVHSVYPTAHVATPLAYNGYGAGYGAGYGGEYYGATAYPHGVYGGYLKKKH